MTLINKFKNLMKEYENNNNMSYEELGLYTTLFEHYNKVNNLTKNDPSYTLDELKADLNDGSTLNLIHRLKEKKECFPHKYFNIEHENFEADQEKLRQLDRQHWEAKRIASHNLESANSIQLEHYENGNVKSISFFNKEGKLHRWPGPAYVEFREDGAVATNGIHYINGQRK